MGDAVSLFDPQDPSKGFAFEGRLSEDFKLSTGTWVRVGPLRQRFLAHFGDIVQDVVIAGHERDEVTALAFPAIGACRALCGANAEVALRTSNCSSATSSARPSASASTTFAQVNTGHSTRVARLILLEDPPSIDAQETTDKGSVNQKSVLTNRAALVEQLYGADGPGIVISRDHQAASREARDHDHRYGNAHRH